MTQIRNEQPSVVEVAKVIKWGVGSAIGVLTLLVLIFTVGDRVGGYFQTSDKAKLHEHDDALAFAWIRFGIADLKASATRQWFLSCQRDKNNIKNLDCTQFEQDAKTAHDEATDLKRDAAKAGKEK